MILPAWQMGVMPAGPIVWISARGHFNAPLPYTGGLYESVSAAVVYIKCFAAARVSSPEKGSFFTAFLCSRRDKERQSPKAGLYVCNTLLVLKARSADMN